MKLLLLCLFFGVALDLARADPPQDKPNPEELAEPESVDDSELSEAVAEPESVDETELSEAEDADSGKRCVKIFRAGVWYVAGGRSYIYFPQAWHWADAQRHCLSLGGNLAASHNINIERFLKALAKSRPAWIGFSDAQQDRYWFWINGERQTFSNWCRGEPNNYRGPQDCALINWTGRKCWDDQSCRSRYPFICERK